MATQRSVPHLSRRKLLRGALAATCTAAGGALLAACGVAPAPTATAPAASGTAAAPGGTVTSTARASAAGGTGGTPGMAGSPVATPGGTPGTAGTPGAAPIAGKFPGGDPLVPDAYTQLPPSFKSSAPLPTGGGKISIFMIAYNPPPTPKEQNSYWRELERRLGMQLDITFVAAASYQERIAASTAAGDLPDLVYINTGQAPDQFRALLQGAYTDITPFVTGSALQAFPNLAAFPERLWQTVAINKKVYGVPRMRYFANSPLFFRQDWAEKVGITKAQNADELFKLLVALTKNDPNGNGQADTFGLTGMSSDVFALNWFYHMFRVPNGWRLNADGTLTSQIETEEFRSAIGYVRRLREAGAFHPDAATMSLQQARDAFIASKIGGYSSGFLELPGAEGLRAKTRTMSAPGAKVIALLPPGHDGGKPAWRTGGAVFGFVAINSRVGRDQERARNLLRFLDWWAAPFGSDEYIFINFGLAGQHHTVSPEGALLRTAAGRAEIAEIPLIANSPPVFFYPDTPEDGPYLQGVIREMLDTGVSNPVESLYSPTATQKTAELNQLQKDRLTDIILGRKELTALDEFIADWRSRGGDTIRREFQDALKQ